MMLDSDKSLKHWLSELPMANPLVAGGQVLGVIHQLTDSERPARRKVSSAKLIEGTADSILRGLEKSILGQSVPLQRELLKKQRLGADLRIGLGQIYLEAARQSAEGRKVGPLARRSINEWLALATYHFSRAMLQCWLAYAQTPVGLWRSLHQAFALSHRIGASANRVRVFIGPRDKTTIRAEYIRLMMTLVADPARRTQHELLAVYSLAHRWSDSARIGKAGGEAGWVVNPQQDRPVYWQESPNSGWHLDFSKVRASIETQETYDCVDEFGAPAQASAALVESALTNWEGLVKRQFRRVDAGFQLLAVVGIQAAHFKIGGEAEFRAYLEGLPVPADAAGFDRSIRDHQPSVNTVQAFDQSFGGYRVRWPETAPVRVRVGELVALAQPFDDDEQPCWMLAMVSWVSADDDGAVEVGLRLLSRRPVAAAARTSARRFERAFVLPAESDVDDDKLLLEASKDKPAEIALVRRYRENFHRQTHTVGGHSDVVCGYRVFSLS